MKYVLLAFFSLILTSTVIAQSKDDCDFELEGVILDADTKEALPYVQVRVKGKQRLVLTDINGNFKIDNLCNEFNELIISCVGYCDTVCENFHQHSNNPHIYIEQDVHQLKGITVTAQGNQQEGTVSMSQQSLDKNDLSVNTTQTLASAVSEIAGVTFAATGNNVQLPIIHGLYGNRVLVLNNSLKHGFQNWGTDHAPEIDISSANSIRVIKGASGVQYGPEALGGAIIVEADPLYLNEPFKANIGVGYETNGQGYFTKTRIAQGLDNWSYHIGANFSKIGDRNTPDYVLTNLGKGERSINGGLRYHTKNWDFKAYYSYIDQDLGLLRSSVAESANSFIRAINADGPVIVRPFSYDIKQPNQITTHHLGKIEVDWRYGDEGKISLRLGKQLNQREEYDVRRNGDRPIINLDLTTDDYQLEWKHPDWLQLDGLFGLQFFRQNNDNIPGTGTTPFIPNYNTSRYSGFVIENLQVNENTFEAGFRFDYEDNSVRGREPSQRIFRDQYSFVNLTSSLGYVRRLSDYTTFRTNFGTAWRAPNMSELYSFGQHGFKTTYGLLRYHTNENNELSTNRVITLKESNLAPEKGYKWISEWRKNKKKNTLAISGYANYIESFIFERPIGVFGTVRGPMPGYIYDQANALFIGTDLTWQKQWSSAIGGTMELSYLWSMNVREKEPLINQPPITASYKISWSKPQLWKFKASKVSIKPSYTLRQFQAPRTIRTEDLIDGTEVITPNSEIFDFKAAPEGYFLLDLNWQLNLGQFDIGLSLQNTLNTRYRNYLNEMRYFADEIGRNFLMTINYNFNSKLNSR